MSPPLVSLSKKEPLKPAFDELPDEKPGSDDKPSVITIDADRRARIHRRQAKRKQCRIIISAVTLLIILAVLAAMTFTLVKFLRRHRSSFKINSAGASTDVSVDDDKQLIHTKHNKDDGNNGHIVVTEILHVYERHLIAYRDVANSTCYIDRLDETFETGYQRWESYDENNSRQPKALKVIDHKPIEMEVLKHIGDIHIYGHCKSGDSYWAMEIELQDVTTEMTVVYA